MAKKNCHYFYFFLHTICNKLKSTSKIGIRLFDYNIITDCSSSVVKQYHKFDLNIRTDPLAIFLALTKTKAEKRKPLKKSLIRQNFIKHFFFFIYSNYPCKCSALLLIPHLCINKFLKPDTKPSLIARH